jgi:HAD superfamily hydrolase (TIGR01662 family)
VLTLTFNEISQNAKGLAIFDKDGTLVKDSGFVHKVEDFKWNLAGLIILRVSSLLNYSNFVVTNQSGIAKKKFTENQCLDFCNFLQKEAQRKKCEIAEIYICPHLPNSCECRKPRTLTFSEIKKKFKDIPSNVIMIGNSKDDYNFAKNISANYVDINSKLAIIKFIFFCLLK